jgi:uncharacterized protein (TIGR02996 family)
MDESYFNEKRLPRKERPPDLPEGAQALLDDIIAAPDDDAPRLVYADWLLAREDPRGELITVQCELARLQRTGGDPEQIRRLTERSDESSTRP